MKYYEPDSQGLELALMARGRHSHRGKPWNKNKGKYHAKQRGMVQSDSYVRRNVECEYCGKSGHLVKDCYRRKNHESNHRYKRYNGNFIHKDTPNTRGFKNLRLNIIFEAALSAKIDDENAWFIDFGASAKMSCNKDWFD